MALKKHAPLTQGRSGGTGRPFNERLRKSVDVYVPVIRAQVLRHPASIANQLWQLIVHMSGLGATGDAGIATAEGGPDGE